MSLNDRENFRKADISSTDDEISHLARKLGAAANSIGVPFKPPFHRSKDVGDPLGAWADRIRGHIDRAGLTGNRVRLAWYIFDKFDRTKGYFWHGLETIEEALNIDRSTVIRGLEYFEKRGFLVCLKRHGGPGQANRWMLSLPHEKGGTYGPPLEGTKGGAHVPPLESEKGGTYTPQIPECGWQPEPLKVAP